MQQGSIARVTDRGFGFLSMEGSDKDVFFHAKELQGVEFNDLKEGDQMQFEVVDGPKGPNAVNISRAGDAPAAAASDDSDAADEAAE